MLLTELNPAYKSVVKSWIKNIPEVKKEKNTENLKWIEKHHETIDDYIMKPIMKNNVEQQRADTTLRAHYNILLQISRGLQNTKLVDIYKAKFDTFNKKIYSDNENNPLLGDQLENFVEWKNILLKRDQLLKRFIEDTSNNYNNLSSLAMALMTFIPPIRSEYSDMRIIYKKEDDDDIHNFILSDQGKYTVIINDDKVSQKYGKGVLPIKNETLTNLIDVSLEEYPRKYLLSSSVNQHDPLKYRSYYNMLINSFKNENKKVGVDVLRKSFLTDYYSKVREPIKEKEVARQMRHSIKTSKEHYRRWLTPEMKRTIKLKIQPL